jgi:hypothetical protein
MGILALGIEDPHNMTVQRLHDPDARHHRWPAARHQHQNLDRRLSFRQVRFLLITVAIDQYAEKALGNRDYFLNKPYGVG